MKGLSLFLKSVFNSRVWGYGLFWSWNVIFLAFMLLGFAPNVLPEMLMDIRAGLIPADFLVYATVLTVIPALAVALGWTVLRKAPRKLLVLGYGVEGPLMLLLLARLFLVRQATPPVILVYAVAILGVFTLLWQLLDRRIDERGKLFSILRLSGLTLLLLVGVYAGAIVAFYAVPISLEIPEFFSVWADGLWWTITHMEWRNLVMLPMAFLGTILLMYTASLFIAAPLAVPVLYIANWVSGIKAVSARVGRVLAYSLIAVVSLGVGVLFVFANRQPQHRAYQLLMNPPQSISDATELLQQRDVIRTGLLNAYLAPVRYLSAVGEVGHIRSLYTYTLEVSEETAMGVERVFERFARPMLYEPMEPVGEDQTPDDVFNQVALRSEPRKAAEMYEEFFDEPITKGERETIVRAVRDTWNGDQALAAWQAVDDREVLLTEQVVTVTEHGDWAEVELFEVYQNQSTTRQEVVYYFSLPETAVLTGLWLGTTPDRQARSSFTVAPRGAAQQVYREQLIVNKDPALLEQVGPRQYRLRVFPIEPQTWRWDDGRRSSEMEPGQPMYLWLTYQVLVQGNTWPLPQLAEKANVYWDFSSQREIAGRKLAGESEAWLPAFLDASAPVAAKSHQVTFPGGESVLLSPWGGSQQPVSFADLRLAVVLDRSRSMVGLEAEVEEALSVLRTQSYSVDVYLTASQYRGESASVAKLASLTPNNIIYFGGQNPAELLAQFFDLYEGRSYDALFVLTDGNGFKLGGADVEIPIPGQPVWMVHLGSDFPLGYDDATAQAIQVSGGGVAGSLEEAQTRLSVAMAAGETAQGVLRDVVDGYEWLAVPADRDIPNLGDVVVHSPDDPFAAFAARRLILSEMQRQRAQISDLATLDGLHAIAMEQGIVTPYSSMIVLVNERQEKRLEQLEGWGDRFQREAEEVGGTTPSPFQVTGVPEPHEWLLIGVGLIVLVWYSRRRLFQHQQIRR